MPHVTAILGEEVGIQYQGVKDASSLIGAYPISGVIVGSFRRGRLDQPMTITRENVKAKLGYDPTNPDYLVVQDALDSGVPSVQVLRVIENTEKNCMQINSSYGYFFPIFWDGMLDEQKIQATKDLFNSMTFEVNGRKHKVSDLMQMTILDDGLTKRYVAQADGVVISLHDGSFQINYGNESGLAVTVCAKSLFHFNVPL